MKYLHWATNKMKLDNSGKQNLKQKQPSLLDVYAFGVNQGETRISNTSSNREKSEALLIY